MSNEQAINKVSDLLIKALLPALEQDGISKQDILDGLMVAAGFHALENGLLREYDLANSTNQIIHKMGKK